jgi:hypothetical protein
MAMLLGGFAFLALDEAMQRVEELEEELKAQDQDKDNSASGKDKETTGEEKLTIKTEEIEGRAEPRRLDPNRPEGSENWREKRFNGLRYSIVPLNERGSARAVFSRSPRRCNRAAPAPGSR